ncbi:MAG: T9SS type A sorting domain-containing protein, partial [Bacteroidales bacterium]|nr:T9SS type A sorting domain-containing protein [Bacteroidales bacterium]
DIFNYDWVPENEWGAADSSYIQQTVWQFAGHGIEEVVPEDVVSIPGGPMVSVIGDYDGFVHSDVSRSPALGRHLTTVDGSAYALGTTRGLAYAPLSGKLAKCADVRSVSTSYNSIPIGPVQYSTDNGETWTVETYTSNPPVALKGGKVALSADGAVTLWMPSAGTTMYRHAGSAWNTVDGIGFNGRPVGDQVDADLFYVYNPSAGYMLVSTDKGATFSQGGFVGTSNFRKAVAVPGKAGHVWVPRALNGGGRRGALMRSSDGGASFTAVPGLGYCEAVGFGKAAEGADYPTIFAFAEKGGVLGVWRSTDEGDNWLRVNDDAHEYGGLANGEFVVGDMNVFGRVYMSTAGRGIAYGEPDGTVVPDPDPEVFELTVIINGAGSVSPMGGAYQAGTTVALTAVADEGHVFSGWSGSASGDEATLVLVMNATQSVTASFVADTTGGGGDDNGDDDHEGGDEEPICDDPTAITIPFVQNGAGEFCWVSSQGIAYINSWNLESLVINGMDYTNTWSNSLPEPINGQYFIYYKGNYGWSHFEIPQTKVATVQSKKAEVEKTVLFPNPFSQQVTLHISAVDEVKQIRVTDLSGRTVAADVPVAPVIRMGDDWAPGTYLVEIRYADETQVYKIFKR